jgi:2-polyprenyl-3-methyl-5-hydroxy-6-metoxy-1,4-benzoquinol methylase
MDNSDKLPIYMTPEDWKKSYEGEEPPHWAEEMKPSPLAGQLLEMLPQKKGNKILEIGVGNGRDSVYFVSQNNEVTGIDIAEGAIKLAKENALKSGVGEKVNFVKGKAEELGFNNESFDAVYSISVLHATILPESLSEIARVLKPGGKAIIYLYEMTESNGKNYWFWKKEKVEQLVKENGLSIEDQWDFWDPRHEGEKTKVLVFKIGKPAPTASS